ncbi:MAG: indole-3-glycerol phosphate synthase TrpC [Chitinophagaceae bacterium]|nr:MAG: indole-3-glycerol phosphate synthase TrpC [Chitinophagaceae bacterium]
MNILDAIIKQKRAEVGEKKKMIPLEEVKQSEFFNRQTLSMKAALLDVQKTGIIAEFKRKSPSKGDINKHADVVHVTTAYANNGASALSVLTDGHFFGGSPNDLIRARVNQLPIIRKDFIIDEYQIVESKAMGADAILLIAACLSPLEVKQLAEFAVLMGLEVLLELHDEDELGHICDKIDLVGINNRSLKTFEVDIERSLAMAAKIPAGKVKIAESGISSVDTIRLFKKEGFNGFLIGENFMKQENPGLAFEQFVNLLRSN